MFKLTVTLALSLIGAGALSGCNQQTMRIATFGAAQHIMPMDNFGEILGKKK